MSEAMLIFVLGIIFTTGGGIITYVLKDIVEALKEIRHDLRLLGKEMETRVDGIDSRLTSIESQHSVYHKC